MINATTGALPQTVEGKEAILYTVDRVRSKRCNRCCGGWLYHDLGSGQFQLVNDKQCNAVFEVKFNANVGAPAAAESSTTPTATTGTSQAAETAATPAAAGTDMKFAIMSNGEAIGGTEMLATVPAGKLENIAATTLVQVPHGASVTITVDNIGSASAVVQDGNITLTKVA